MTKLNNILTSIETKKSDYRGYDFTQIEGDALTTFFDLAQEYDDIHDFHTLCVAIPRGFFNLHSKLYLFDPKVNYMVLVSKTEDPEYGLGAAPPSYIKPNDQPYCSDGSLVLPIRGRRLLIDQLPFEAKDNVLGILQIYPATDLDNHQELFFEKYANRIGFNIHNRYLLQRNIEHLNFIRTLVADIGHNVIAPNIAYKLFLKRLKGKIMKNVEIEKLLTKHVGKEPCDEVCIEHLFTELKDANRGLMEEFENIEKHYQSTTLFLETLLRRSHFDEGRLTLRTKPCNIKKDVVQPQLERFSERFKETNISINDRISGIPDEETITVVDVGLISQVYANLFSNALKYAQEITTQEGEKKKYISYGNEVIKDYFGQGKDGVKYNVFNTGTHIKPEEREIIFDEGYRGSNSSNRPGTGLGLTFIKNTVEIHGGAVGYEATQYGNNFYFILPK